jgi:hypothetical protein
VLEGVPDSQKIGEITINSDFGKIREFLLLQLAERKNLA